MLTLAAVRPWLSLRRALLLAVWAAALPVAALETPPLLGSFSGNSSAVVGIAIDDVSGEVFAVGSTAIERYSPGGTFLGTIPLPSGGSSSIDLDFSTTALDVAGTIVPANSLLVFDDDAGLREFFALDKTTGAILASTSYPNTPGTPSVPSVVGVAVDGSSGTILTLAFTTNEMGETNLASGASVGGPVTVAPAPPTTFSINFGDVDVASNGDIYVVGSPQDRIRIFGPHGDFIRDFQIPGAGGGWSALALDDATSTAWLANVGGSSLSHITIPPPGGTSTLIASCPTGLSGIVALAISPTTGNLFAMDTSGPSFIQEFTAGAGCALQGSIGWPNIGGTNAVDFDILVSSLDVGGAIVPAGSLIGLDENTTPRFNALSIPVGTLLASDTLPNLPSLANVGLARSESNGHLHTVDFVAQRVHLVDASDGSLPADSFSVQPPQFFDVFNGDIEVYEGSDTVLVVGSGTSAIRVLSRDGDFLGDMGLGHLGIADLSGIAIDPSNGEIWLSTDQPPEIHRLPEPSIPTAWGAGALTLAFLAKRRR